MCVCTAKNENVCMEKHEEAERRRAEENGLVRV